MNNCPKCGNPLQDGVTSCPICGTNISLKAETAEVTEPAPAPAAPVEPAPAPAPAPQAEPVAQPAAQPAPAPEAPAQPVAEPAPAAPVEPAAPAAPVQPAPAAEPAPAPQAEPVQPAVQPTVPPAQPAAEPVQPTVTPAQPAAETPAPAQPAVTLENVVTPAPAPAAEAPAPAAPAPAQPTADAKKPKKKNKNLPIILIAVAAVVGIGIYMSMPKGTVGPNNANQPATQLKMSDVASHGYKFKIPEGWVVRENKDDVIVVNNNETVYVKFDHSSDNIDTLNTEVIENYLKTKTVLTDTSVESSKINASNAFIINGKNNGTPAQVFFIGGGSNLMLGVAVSYQSDESKTINEAAVQEMIGTISYSDDSLKAIDIISMYSELFGTYQGVLYAKNNPAPETPEGGEKKIEPANPETPAEDENKAETKTE